MRDINNNIGTLKQTIRSIDSQIAELNRIKQEVKDEITEITKDKIHCKSCGNYFDYEESVHREELETVRECVHTDCGYGDDDLFADVTYKVYYKLCPYCNKEVETARFKVSQGRSVDRWGN